MGNLLDYLEWRGDLTLSQVPFNQVDGLLLACLSYFPFDKVVLHNGKTILLEAACIQLSTGKNRQDETIQFMAEHDKECCTALQNCPRYKQMELSFFVNDIDLETEKQFSAITISVGDGSYYIAYRGTDSNLVGWKEDLNLFYLPVIPSQQEAVDYLQMVAMQTNGFLRLGGHSKGGNLAMFAASSVEEDIQKRIIDIFDYDSPGMKKETLEKTSFKKIAAKIHSFIPQTSVVGMLLQRGTGYTVVSSTQEGLYQHDPYSWEIYRSDFIKVRRITERSKQINQTLQQWIEGMTLVQRKQFIDGLYTAMVATNASTVDELAQNTKNIAEILKAIKHIDEETRHIIREAVATLFSIARKNRRK